MSTANRPTSLPPEVLADWEEVCRHVMSGGVRDPELLRRIEERSRQAREEILLKHGELNVAVELIRQGRDEA